MKSKKKSTKAVTLLTRMEALLSDVLDECSAIEKSAEKNVRALLLSAEKSIAKAKDFIISLPPSEVRPTAAKSRKRRTAKSKKRSMAHAG